MAESGGGPRREEAFDGDAAGGNGEREGNTGPIYSPAFAAGGEAVCSGGLHGVFGDAV